MGNVSVGTLVVDLTANTASFVTSLDKAGQIALNSSKNIKKAFDALAPSVLASLSAVEAAVAAMVDASISNMARLADMSQSTGVATEALSALEYAAKQSGIGAEQLDGALEKMARSMEKAAAQGHSGSDAYKTLGVSVTDSNGKLRPTVDILEDLASKFASFKDGPEKTALAMQIFGKSGAEMVPLLNRGKDGIADLVAQASKMGLVIGGDAAEAAKKFEESLTRLEAAATGAANKMATELLPTFQMMVDKVNNGSPAMQSSLESFGHAAMNVFKGVIAALSAVGAVILDLRQHFDHLYAGVILGWTALGQAITDISKRDWSGLKTVVRETSESIVDQQMQSLRDSKKIWTDYAGFVSNLFADQPQAKSKPGGPAKKDAPSTPDANAGKAQEAIQKRISDLEKQATAEIMVAAAQQLDTAATIQGTAAAQAREFIDKANADLAQKKAGHLTQAQIATVRAAESEKAFASVAKETGKNLAETATKTGEQTNAVTAMAAAYSKGGAAIAQAQEAAQIAPFQKKVDDLSAAFDRLKVTNPGATQQIKAMSTALDQAQAELVAVKHAFDEYNAAQRQSNTDRLATDTERQIAATKGYAEALLKGADALRQFEINQKLLDYQNNSAFDQSAEAVARYRRQLEDLYAAQDLRAVVDRVHAQDHQSDLKKEIALLQQLRAAAAANGQSTLAIDAALHTAEMQRRQDLNNQLLQTNSIKNGFKVFWDEYANSGVTAAQRVNQFMHQTMNNFTSTLSKALVEGKADWRGFATTAVESLVEIGIQELISHMARKAMHAEERMDNAKTVFGNVYKALSGIPIIGPVLAPVAASAAFATVMAFREGGIVPGDGNDGVPALLHPREMVLPERVAKTVTDGVRSGGDGSSGGKSMTVNYNPVIQGNADEELLHQKFEIWTKAEFRKRGLRF